MTPELSQKNIEAAEYFNREVRRGLAKKHGKAVVISADAEAWRERVLYGFAMQTLEEYVELKRVQNTSLSSLAFHTRNLLELMIWVAHCTSDERHLRSLYEDASKDGRELLDAWKKYMVPEITESISLEIEGAIGKLRQSANDKGVEDIGGKYQSVSSVAALYPELDSYFKISSKMLSKFAHPTALAIIGIPDAAVAQLRLGFYVEGCLWFSSAIRPVAIRLGIELDDPLGQELESILK